MVYDTRFAGHYPDPDHSLELAARLLAACPGPLQGLKTTKEVFDKTVELAEMLRERIAQDEKAAQRVNLEGKLSLGDLLDDGE